ncbi:MAG: ion transporter [Chloroflexi bacterium]|nr:ion transporter [Chloroflexota bacterium]
MTNQPDTKLQLIGKSAGRTTRELDYELFIFVFTVYSLLVASAILFLPLTPGADQILRQINLLITFVFLADFIYRLHRAENKIVYMKSLGWLDLLGSLPVYPLFRFFRGYRLFVVWRELRKYGSRPLWVVIKRRRAENALRYAGLALFFVVTIGSILVLQFESLNPEGNIRTAQEAVWWSMVTIATVGYGDYYPVTLDGRLVGIILMIVGVGMFGVLSSYLATNFLSPTKEEKEQQEQQAKQNLVDTVRDEINPLKDEIATLRTELTQIHQMLSNLPGKKD